MSVFEPRTVTLRDGTAVTLRTPDVDEAGKLLDYLDAVRRESWGIMFCPHDTLMSIDQERAWIASRRDSPDTLMVGVWTTDDELIGLAGVDRKTAPWRVSHTASLGISIRRSHWRQGLGRLVTEALVAFAQSRSAIEVLQLAAFPFNRKAVALYESFGFVQDGLCRHAVRFEDGSFADQLLMSRWVGQGDPPAETRQFDPCDERVGDAA